MMDLHTHTVYSDGSSTVRELLTQAQALGLEVLSITDHNTVDAYHDPTLACWRQLYKGQLLPGVEITCMLEGEIVEVLGYGYDLEEMEKQLKKHLLSFREKQLREAELILTALPKAGAVLDPAMVQFDPDQESCRKAVLAELKKYPGNYRLFSSESGWKTSRGFTRHEIYNPQSALYVDESPLYPTVKQAVEMIHASGGIAFLAHLFIYAHAERFFSQLDAIQRETGLDGIECRHSVFTVQQAQRLEQFCTEYHLLRSGGSDFHGARKPDVELGNRGGLTVPSKWLACWPEKILSHCL